MTIGSTISHYRIVEKLGEGGMGVVYKADDTKLDRPVALKFLPAHLLDNLELRKRFEREAKSAAALDHPNICTVHEIDDADGKIFISMALIEGESLDQKIARGPLKLDEALGIVEQVAKGLAAAHKRGIVHRDIKPENIMVGEDGHVTIMDFGLAQLTEASRLTKTDETVGTVGYMSPEQTDGSGTDHRTDIWSLGVVLYEMVTGQQPFRGDYDQAVMYSILNEQPEPVTAMRTGVPMELERIIDKCLSKDRARRYQSVAELAVDLRTLAGTSVTDRSAIKSAIQPVQPAKELPSPFARQWLPWGISAVLAIALAGAGLVSDSRTPPKKLVTRFSFTPADYDPAIHGKAVISPNGEHIAYAAERGVSKLWVRDLDEETPHEFIGTEGASNPFWSPDSRHIAFVADGSLKRVSIEGGQPSIVGALPSTAYFQGAWSPDGETIVFSAGPGGPARIYSTPADSSNVRLLFEPIRTAKGTGHNNASLLPTLGGRHAVLLDVGRPKDHDIVVFDLDSKQHRVLRRGVQPVYSDTGHILYRTSGAAGGIWALPFSVASLEPTGEPFLIEGQGTGPTLSATGTLVYADYWPSVGQDRAIWVDRNGERLGTFGQQRTRIRSLSLSPDGELLAIGADDDRDNVDVWVQDESGQSKTRLTLQPAMDNDPVWSPSGEEVVYRSENSEGGGVRIRPIDGAKDPLTIIATERIERPTSWSNDGRYLLYSVTDPVNANDIWFSEVDSAGSFSDGAAFRATAADEQSARFSPNGRYVAYCSNETGRYEVYVLPFPEGTGVRQISTAGGCAPQWSPEGNELFYVRGTELMAVEVTTEPRFAVGPAERLFDHPYLISTGVSPQRYDVARGGQRFVLIDRIEADDAPADAAIHIVENWYEEFRDRDQ